MRKRKSREQIKPTMTNEQLQEFISAGINQSSIDARVNQSAIDLAGDFKSKVEQRRGHDKGHEPVGGVLAGKSYKQRCDEVLLPRANASDGDVHITKENIGVLGTNKGLLDFIKQASEVESDLVQRGKIHGE